MWEMRPWKGLNANAKPMRPSGRFDVADPCFGALNSTRSTSIVSPLGFEKCIRTARVDARHSLPNMRAGSTVVAWGAVRQPKPWTSKPFALPWLPMSDMQKRIMMNFFRTWSKEAMRAPWWLLLLKKWLSSGRGIVPDETNGGYRRAIEPNPRL